MWHTAQAAASIDVRTKYEYITTIILYLYTGWMQVSEHDTGGRAADKAYVSLV